MEDITLYLLQGFCNLLFGDSPQKASLLFGAPDEEEVLKEEVLNETTLVYHYWNNGFSLFFKGKGHNSLHCVEVDNKAAVLMGETVFQLKEEEIKMLFKSNGFNLSETEQQTWGEKRLSFDEAFADLYFENGRLTSINFCANDNEGSIDKLSLN